MLRRLSSDNLTHIIIDFPEMLVLQKYYLSNISDELKQKINFITGPSVRIKTGCINLLPINWIDEYCEPLTNLNIDLFIATWSMSEATNKIQNRIVDLKFFEAKYILYGYFKFEVTDLPFTLFSGFKGYEDLYHEKCFFDKNGYEWYRIMKKALA